MAKAIDDSSRPTADDKEGGYHEEYGVAGLDASKNWIVSRDMPGPYGNPAVTVDLAPSGKPVDESRALSIVDHRVAFHVHPNGKAFHLRPDGRIETRVWNQPPSENDKAAVVPGQTHILFAAGEKKVYFYDSSGVIGRPMSLKDFLSQ
jgi:hypothetical protein